MKRFLFPLLLVISQLSFGQLFFENFSGEADGAVSGTATGGTWSVTTTPGGGAASYSKQTSLLGNGNFRPNDTGTEGIWTSSVIDISGTGVAVISVGLFTLFTNSTDYIRCYYKVDGGAETQFAELLGQTLSITTAGSAIVTGSTLQLVIKSVENTGGGLSILRFDDVTVSAVIELYSRQSGNWNDNSAPGTWSTTSHVGGDCLCVPGTNNLVYIGAGHIVNMNVAGTTGGLVIEGTAGSELRYTAGVSLTMSGGLLDVQSGSTGINRNAIAGTSIVFSVAIPVSVNVNAPVSTGGLTFTAGSTANISGSNTVSINGNISMNEDNATLNNSITITATGNILADNGTIGVPSVTINNNSGATLSFAVINMDDASIIGDSDITLNNSGTINQTGTFSTIDAGSTFNNLDGATWNYSGTGHDTDTRLLANNPTNTFTYGLSGAQQIITPVAGDGYNNLVLQSVAAGAKTALGNFSVSGNYTRSGLATLANGGFTITLNGTATQSISAVGGETFAGLTINNTFATSPQVTLNNAVTVSGTLTMTDGNINLNSTIFTIGASAAAPGTLSHGGASTNGWMYGGTLRRFISTTAIALLNVRGLFPLGTSGTTGDFRPFYISTTGVGTGGSLSLTHTNATTTTTVSFLDGATTILRRHDAFWTCSTSGIVGGTYGIRYGGTNFGTITSLNHLRSCLVASVIAGTTHVTAATVSTSDPRVERSGLTLANMSNSFYLCSTDLASPLPIELIEFTASLRNSIVELNWSTASEFNNDFFTVERTVDFEEFDKVGIVKGQGTSKIKTSYSSFDESPLLGISYYRLRQTDYDGRYTFSEVRSIDNSVLNTQLKVYPNPVTESRFTFEISNVRPAEEIMLRIVNLQGASVFEASYTADSNGNIKSNVELNPVAGGMYAVIINSSVGLKKKIIIE